MVIANTGPTAATEALTRYEARTSDSPHFGANSRSELVTGAALDQRVARHDRRRLGLHPLGYVLKRVLPRARVWCGGFANYHAILC